MKTMNHARYACYSGLKLSTLTNINCAYKKLSYNFCLYQNLYSKLCCTYEERSNIVNSMKKFAKVNAWNTQRRLHSSCSNKTSNNLVDDKIKSNDSDLADDLLKHMKTTQLERKNKKSIFYRTEQRAKNRYFNDGPGLNHFISSKPITTQGDNIPYLTNLDGRQQRGNKISFCLRRSKVYLEIYGCQMNVNDAEVISSILIKSNYEITKDINRANIILLVTCAIRDSAEQKVWNKLENFTHLKEKKLISKIGLLGCMAERLKEKILDEKKIVDVVAGPDSYKDLPRLLSVSNDHETAINVALSMDETYADVTPVRLNPDAKSAYVSIMRGCDNMCTYCIVPFTRGRERSRPMQSILNEVQYLSDQGYKEITLLGQNVNSYRDTSTSNFYQTNNTETNLAKGFKTVYKNKPGGLRFSDLLDKVSLINPEMRIRFTSPHPKDFPDEVLYLIAERSNICKQLHLPAQSGSSSVLERMRRGYTREAYLDLVFHIKNIIPDVALSSDFIAGFCGETEEEFAETLTLLEEVKYSLAFLFAYSMREKTTAYRRYADNVDKKVKIERLQKMIKLYRAEVEKLYQSQIGEQQLVLVEGESKRSIKDLQGRNDANVKVIFSNESIPENHTSSVYKPIKSGDYIHVHIYNATSQILRGIPLYHSSINEFYSVNNKLKETSDVKCW